MSDSTFLQVQAIELERLLNKSADDPILGPQLRERLEEVRRELRQPGRLLPNESPAPPRTAVFLRGGGVRDSEGITPGLASEILSQYEKMFVQQAIHDEREAAKAVGRQRRPRGADAPTLLFTGTPRGSFGLEFSPQYRDDDTLRVHSQSLLNVAEAITTITASAPDSLQGAIEKIPPRVLQPLKRFVKTLAEYGAEVRLAFQDRRSHAISVEVLKATAELLERDVEQEKIALKGVSRGVTLESGVFDLKLEDGSVITAHVADDLTDEDLERIAGLFNRKCVAELEKTVVRKIGGEEKIAYVLIDAKAAEQ